MANNALTNGHCQPLPKHMKMEGETSQAKPFLKKTASMLRERQGLGNNILLDGGSLSVAKVAHVCGTANVHVDVAKDCWLAVSKNSKYLKEKIDKGLVVYGVNTGFGGSADVRHSDTVVIQESLIKHLNAGFGEVFDPCLSRGVMLIRANSLCGAMSGVRPEVIKLICDMIREDINPIVPKRGSVSASGDLMPTSYIASAMMGRPDCQVIHKNVKKPANEALATAGLQSITFETKEALAVINSASFATCLASNVLYSATSAALLTQITVAMSVEALRGRTESFHPTIHRQMPHRGQCEVADNILNLLTESQMCISDLDMKRQDEDRCLKQDRYPLRTAAQWLAPSVDLLERALDTVQTDMNSVNDNPIIDHVNDTILHGGNFQGVSVAVAMDNTRQALQLCGKLMFAMMSEVVNVNLNNHLPPNLSGCDITRDFGFKGTDTAMASYMSELDMLTSPVTRHVLSAEMANQSVNSLGLLSARWSEQALTVLQQMLANILVCLAQAIDLRWLQGKVTDAMKEVCVEHDVNPLKLDDRIWPWYEFVFNASVTCAKFAADVMSGRDSAAFIRDMEAKMNELNALMKSGAHVPVIEEVLGKGTRQMYVFIRKELGIKFYDGEHFLDMDLRKMHAAIVDRSIESVLLGALC